VVEEEEEVVEEGCFGVVDWQPLDAAVVAAEVAVEDVVSVDVGVESDSAAAGSAAEVVVSAASPVEGAGARKEGEEDVALLPPPRVSSLSHRDHRCSTP
jgi:hypothetical protein